jgi:hypothetical protein
MSHHKYLIVEWVAVSVWLALVTDELWRELSSKVTDASPQASRSTSSLGDTGDNGEGEGDAE